MEEEQYVEICSEKIDDNRNEDKERKRERDKEKDREKEKRRSKHKESRKAEKRESREKGENIQRRAAGEEVRMDKKEEESKRSDHEGQIVDHGNSVILAQTPLSCQEDNLIIKEEKPGKSIKSAAAHHRGSTAEPGSKGRSRDDKHGTGHSQSRGERDSKGGGEKILDRPVHLSLPGTHPESRKGGSENLRTASEEWESWMDPYICPLSHRPKYSYRAMEKEEEDFKYHHERQYCPSPESLTEPSCRIAHIMHSNLSNPEPKVNHTGHRSPDKAARPEGKDPNRKRSESRQSPTVHLYMSELAAHSLETKSPTPNPQADTRASAEHSKRKSRRSSKEDIGNGNSAHTLRPPDEETLTARDDDKLKTISKTPRETAAEVGSKGRSREDKYYSGHRGERDSKGGGEKICLPGEYADPRQGGSESHGGVSEARDSWGDPYTNPSSRRPKYSFRASTEKAEEIRYDLEKHSGPCCVPAELNLRTSQKTEYTVMTNIISPEVRRKHLKHKALSKDQLKGEAAAKELGNIQPEILQRMDAELTMSRTHPKPAVAAEQIPSGLGDVPLSPEFLARQTRKSSREKNTVAVNTPESWNGQETGSAAVNKGHGNGEGGVVTAGGRKSLENWGNGVFPEIQTVAKHRDRFPETEKKEKTQGSRPPHSRRPRYSYGTNIEMEDENFYPLNRSVSPYSQRPTESVCRITKSEYMVSSTSTSPELNKKLIRYTSSLEEQPSTLSNFINKAKQLEIATSMQPISAYGSPSKSCLLSSASPTKDNQQGLSNGLDFGGTTLTYKAPDSGVHAANSQERLYRERQRDIYFKPFLHDLPDGDTDREREETSAGDVKLTSTHSNTSLRQRAMPSLGMILADGTVCVDVPRPMVSASRKNLTGTSSYGTEMVYNKIRPKTGHFKHQYHESQKRSLQTRKRYQEEVKAALMIQAAWKGYQTRAQIRKQAEAAIRIQAAYRGYQIRKFLTEGISENETDELNDVQDGEWQSSEYPEIFLEEISHSDYSESDADSGEDWRESPVSIIMGSPESYRADNGNHEDTTTDVCSPNPLLQYESVYQSQSCNWGGI